MLVFNTCFRQNSLGSSLETMRREIARPPFASTTSTTGSTLVVLVVAVPPGARLVEARFVTSLGGTVEPLVHAPEAIQSARIGGIGVIDDAVLENEPAHARPLARVRGHVGSGHG